jgi:L-asparaginase
MSQSKLRKGESMKRILLIATGGTIASTKTEEGMTPNLTIEELIEYVPEINNKCSIETIQLFNLDSTNIHSPHWCDMAKCIQTNYELYDGFIITHGTDTMAYTAAALSYLIQDSPKPIVITGSQKPISMLETDARINLRDAFLFAIDDSAYGVRVVFNHKIMLGTRVRKTKTRSYNAFSSIDYPEVAIIRDEQLTYFINDKNGQMVPTFYNNMDPKVFVLKLIPGVQADIFEYLKMHYHAIVIETYGLGGIPYYDDIDFIQAMEDWTKSGRVIVITTQVPHEGMNMGLYEVGYKIKKKIDILEAHDMTIEAVVTKLLWILGQTKDIETIHKMFYTPVQKDILFAIDEGQKR